MKNICLIAGIIVLLVMLLIILCVYYNQALKCVYYNIPKEGIPSDFLGSKIVLLTDLHESEFGKNNRRLIEKIDNEHPDYIMIAGDMLVKGIEMKTDKTFHLLENLSKRYPIYYAPGNHEEYLERLFGNGEYKEFIQKLTKLGVKYLANNSAFIKKGNSQIAITGLHLQKRYFAKFYEKVTFGVENMIELLGTPKGEYQILLAHNPNYFDVYERWGAVLVLSGHVHGGIVILPFLGGLISTTYELFPKYDFGMFQERNARMILSKGLGVHTIKLRLFNVPEISVITLGEESTCEK